MNKVVITKNSDGTYTMCDGDYVYTECTIEDVIMYIAKESEDISAD